MFLLLFNFTLGGDVHRSGLLWKVVLKVALVIWMATFFMIFWLSTFWMPSISHSTGFNKKIQLCWKFCIDGWETCHVWDSCWCSHVCTVMGLSVSISTIQVWHSNAWTVKWFEFSYGHIIIFFCSVSWHLPV